MQQTTLLVTSAELCWLQKPMSKDIEEIYLGSRDNLLKK